MHVRRLNPRVDDTIPTRLRENWGEEDDPSTEQRVFNDDPTNPDPEPSDTDPTDRIPLKPEP
jgi:hypothetical protein